MKSKPAKEIPASGDAPSFEHSLKRLQEIVDSLEHGDVSLNDVMKMYEEGVQISKNCLEQLSRAELLLKRLSKDASGNFELFDQGSKD